VNSYWARGILPEKSTNGALDVPRIRWGRRALLSECSKWESDAENGRQKCSKVHVTPPCSAKAVADPGCALNKK
jgi:hypothetical protein